MNPESTTWWGRGLNLLGAAIVGYYFTRLVLESLGADGSTSWIAVIGYLALAAWVAVTLVSRSRLAATGTLLAIMVISGALVTLPSAGIMVVLPAVGVLRVVADIRRPIWQGVTLVLVATATVATGVFIVSLPPFALVSIEAGLLVAAFAGYGRRQFRESEVLARKRADEQAELAAQERRQAVARDVHDVLAHSLGGLVVQLDAVEALLEAGKTSDAASRVTDARLLAVAGLTEARRAVEALRSDVPMEAVDLSGTIDDLVRAHRSLGGIVNLLVEGVPHRLGAAESTALARTLQESLTNARKHAPGVPVVVTLHWNDAVTSLEVSNALPARAAAAPGGGHGIQGMRERFAGISGATIDAGARGDRFLVSVSVPV